MSKIIVETNNPVWDKTKLVVFINNEGISLKRLRLLETSSENTEEISIDSLLTPAPKDGYTSSSTEPVKQIISFEGVYYFLESQFLFSKNYLDPFLKNGNILFLHLLKNSTRYPEIRMYKKGYVESVLDNTHFNKLTAPQWSEFTFGHKAYNDLVWLYPITNQNLSDMHMIFRLGKASSLITNVIIDKIDNYSNIESINEQSLLLAEITGADTITANESAIMNVRLVRNGKLVITNQELIIEAINGFIPTKRCSIINGLGSFEIVASGLKSGDTLRVKLNTRAFTSLAEKTLNVI